MNEEIEMVSVDPVSLITEDDLRMSIIFDEIYMAARASRNLDIIIMLDKLADSRMGGTEAMDQLEKILNLTAESK